MCDCPLGFSGEGCTKETSKDFDIHLSEGAVIQSVVPFGANCSTWTLGFWIQTSSSSISDSFIILSQLR